jgi:hypothetical protein
MRSPTLRHVALAVADEEQAQHRSGVRAAAIRTRVTWSTSPVRRELPTDPLEPGDALALILNPAFEGGVAAEI